MIDWESWRGLAERLGHRLIFKASLQDHTTFGLGGPALILAFPEKSGELLALVEAAKAGNLPILVLGGGSNLLVTEAGFNGLVLKLKGGFEVIEDVGPGVILAGAGASSAALLARAAARELGGVECLAGLPGTVGGAVAGNSGSGDRAVGRAVSKVFILGDSGEARAIEAGDLKFSYRRLSGLPEGAIILGAEFTLTRRPAGEIRARIRELNERRRQNQPVGGRSAGCVFKNPPGLSAGRLIDDCGFKGARQGGAQVSELHANFIIAEDGATTADILTLIDQVRRGVFERLGVALELELKVVGMEGEVQP